MVRHARNKKRRAGRIGKVKLKNRNYAKFKPPQINDPKIKALWDPTKSPSINMRNLGLTSLPNLAINDRGLDPDTVINTNTTTNNTVTMTAIELFDIPDSDVIPKQTLSMRMLPLSIEKQEYMARCMGKHGVDYKTMCRDIKLNDMQHTENRLRKMGARFLLLKTEERRVDVPSNIQHLVHC
mmetsp:Transcript_2962/g.4150  ORF Transcript_2962/g.4150 Transcript_2962/m.4150 type:complete len:182 (-) Transcript_2962:69-614(-)|eukprot:CAMPEP_0184855954 /NCGR_PEP_ID=MMETSP0580-20130426/1123_1 /TAXON_ID=1118495 /ORGANISM="Dactyliosolen fragilissimus" /LENGTH=181 /DNA_ID=CAMNT_0027350673 /DNA_START=49 /DNA_END=594 /DNA_ORIENTATION=+